MIGGGIGGYKGGVTQLDIRLEIREAGIIINLDGDFIQERGSS